jgi:Protein of unknown function (DUF1449)
MLDVLAAPQSLPFTVALAVVAFICLLELVGLIFGIAPSAQIDTMMPDLHSDTASGGDASASYPVSALDWLAVGRVPVIVAIISFLIAFGVTGLVIERIAFGLTGHYVPALIASCGALLLALPLTRTIGLGLARVLPKDESDAVSVDGFIGKIATVVQGTARRGLPAEAKLTDSRGLTHYIRVEPDIDGENFSQGANVLVVERAGSVFRVIAPQHDALKSN